MARSNAISHLSINELQREIRGRQRMARSLERKRARLTRQLAKVDAALAANGSAIRSSGLGQGAATRAKNKAPLIEALATLLKGKEMTVTDAAAAVRKAGYHTTSPNFRTMVNIQLLNKKRFKRVGRGTYTSV